MPRVAVPAYRPLSQAWHRAHHTEVLMRSTAPRIFQPRKNSRIDAYTCPEGGVTSKPGPIHGATEIEPRAPGAQAVQKYRHRAARTNCARSRVGRGYAALAAMPLGPPDVPRPWLCTGVAKVLFLRERGDFFELAGGGSNLRISFPKPLACNRLSPDKEGFPF